MFEDSIILAFAAGAKIGAKAGAKQAAKSVIRTAVPIVNVVFIPIDVYCGYKFVKGLYDKYKVQDSFGTEQYKMYSNGILHNVLARETFIPQVVNLDYTRLYKMFKCFSNEDIQNAFMKGLMLLARDGVQMSISNIKSNDKYISACIKYNSMNNPMIIIWNDGFSGMNPRYIDNPDSMHIRNEPTYKEEKIQCKEFRFYEWKKAFELCRSALEYVLILDMIRYILVIDPY